MKIAAAHGVLLVPKLIHAGTNTCLASSYITRLPSCDTDQYQSADRYQFRGQWLFINVPRKETNQFSKQKTCGDTAILYVNQFGNPECVATPAPAKTTEPTKGTK
jgi:hypothetical protein